MTYKFDANHFAIDKTKVRGKKGGEEKARGRPRRSVLLLSAPPPVKKRLRTFQNRSGKFQNVPEPVSEAEPVVEEEERSRLS